MAELGELSHLSWRDDMWLQVYGINPLNVLDYFALSPFYDRACSNEVAKQKGVSPQQLACAVWGLEWPGPARLHACRSRGLPPVPDHRAQSPLPLVPRHCRLLAPGIEYSLRDAQPPHLFVICQSHRTAPGATDTPQAFFYVLDGTVYQAPTLSSVIQSRLVGAGESGGPRDCRPGPSPLSRCLSQPYEPASRAPVTTPAHVQQRCLCGIQATFLAMRDDLHPLTAEREGCRGEGAVPSASPFFSCHVA